MSLLFRIGLECERTGAWLCGVGMALTMTMLAFGSSLDWQLWGFTRGLSVVIVGVILTVVGFLMSSRPR